MATTKTKAAPAKKPNRSKTAQINARLSDAEKADLEALIDNFNATRNLPPGTLGFSDWLRVTVAEKKAELEAAKVKPKSKK